MKSGLRARREDARSCLKERSESQLTFMANEQHWQDMATEANNAQNDKTYSVKQCHGTPRCAEHSESYLLGRVGERSEERCKQ